MTVRWSMEDQDRQDIFDMLYDIHDEISGRYSYVATLLDDVIYRMQFYMKPIRDVSPDEDGGLRPLSAGDSK